MHTVFFRIAGFLDTITYDSNGFHAPRLVISWKIAIFLNFESLDLNNYWSDFKKFTHKSYLRVEIRRFSMVSVLKNKNKK